MKNLHILRATEGDWPSIERIYEEGIATGDATFTAQAPASWEEWANGKILRCCLVAKLDDRVVGWAALGAVSHRPAYAGVAVVNIYVERDLHGQGLGTRLLQALIDASEEAGIWTLEARIFPENVASLALHRRHGFREVGIRERIGLMRTGHAQGRWRDVVLLERRSSRAGR